MRLPIPQKTEDKLGLTLYKLFQLSSLVNNSDDQEIILDFQHTQFLHSIFLAGLYSLMQEWKAVGKTVSIININRDIESYFTSVHFPSGFNLHDNPELIVNLNYYKDKNYTPLVLFPTHGESREACINSILDVIHTQINLPVEFIRILDYFVAELTNNIADHSESVCGLLKAQTYPSKGFMDISIADNGIGLLASYNKTSKFNPETEEDAIQMAIRGRSTKDIPESRGFGLSTSRTLISMLGGTFLLWSGKTMYIETSHFQHVLKVEEEAFYKGCYLSMRIPLKPNINIDFYKIISN